MFLENILPAALQPRQLTFRLKVALAAGYFLGGVWAFIGAYVYLYYQDMGIASLAALSGGAVFTGTAYATYRIVKIKRGVEANIQFQLARAALPLIMGLLQQGRLKHLKWLLPIGALGLGYYLFKDEQ